MVNGICSVAVLVTFESPKVSSQDRRMRRSYLSFSHDPAPYLRSRAALAGLRRFGLVIVRDSNNLFKVFHPDDKSTGACGHMEYPCLNREGNHAGQTVPQELVGSLWRMYPVFIHSYHNRPFCIVIIACLGTFRDCAALAIICRAGAEQGEYQGDRHTQGTAHVILFRKHPTAGQCQLAQSWMAPLTKLQESRSMQAAKLIGRAIRLRRAVARGRSIWNVQRAQESRCSAFIIGCATGRARR
jgi:hypothetical protein